MSARVCECEGVCARICVCEGVCGVCVCVDVSEPLRVCGCVWMRARVVVCVRMCGYECVCVCERVCKTLLSLKDILISLLAHTVVSIRSYTRSRQ